MSAVCSEPGCPNLTARGKCDYHRRAARRVSDARRPSAHDRGYDRQWERTRRRYLREHPWCECGDCLKLPVSHRPPAVDVHHRDGLGPSGPRGHDATNLLALSHEHHARITAREQAGGWNR